MSTYGDIVTDEMAVACGKVRRMDWRKRARVERTGDTRGAGRRF
jgi:hypothetical protein